MEAAAGVPVETTSHPLLEPSVATGVDCEGSELLSSDVSMCKKAEILKTYHLIIYSSPWI